MKPSSDVVRQIRKFYAQNNMLLRNFCYYTNNVKCTLFKSLCANMYCCPLWFNSTSSTIKKLTRCTRGDARSFFLYSQNVFVCTKRISYEHIQYCFKNYITLHEFANCNLANYDV